MLLNKNSLWLRLLLPFFVIIGSISLLLLYLVHVISEDVKNDYHSLMGAVAANEINRMLSTATAELTSARLLGNEIVVSAKQRSVAEAIRLALDHIDHDTIIAGADREVLLSTVSATQMKEILSGEKAGYFVVSGDGKRSYCYSVHFPLWGWSVIAASKSQEFHLGRREIGLLLPIVAFGACVMAAGLYAVLRRRVQIPVASITQSIAQGRKVEPVGITEFDTIGGAINESFRKLRERTAELERELEERKKAETALSLKDEHIRLLLESTFEGIYGVDATGGCTFCNPAALRMIGCGSEAEVLGKNIHDLIHHTRSDGSPYPDSQCRAYEVFRSGKECFVEGEVFWRMNGESFPVEYWAFPALKNGGVIGAVVTFMDISERQKLKEQLLQSQKMEAIGHLAGGVAHDFNNILTVILGYGGLAQGNTPSDSRVRVYLDQMMLAANKATELTQGLLAFSRKQVISPKAMDINAIVTSIQKILKRIIGEDIELRIICQSRPLVVLVDRGQVDQVLMNLVTNARDSMPGGGLLNIETGPFTVDDLSLRTHPLMQKGEYACIYVSDTGTGMDDKTKAKIFEPFFTTKEMGRGTGLGLSIVYGIIKQHNGYIDVYSEPGKGTAFKIYLPLVSQEAEEETEAPLQHGSGETLLIVEDDDAVREMLVLLLKDYGYRVIEARDGDAALKIFAESGRDVDLVLMDVVMPGLNGKETYEGMKSIQSGVKVIFMSGYTDDIIHRKGTLDSSLEFISKPIAKKELLGKIHAVLRKTS